MSRPHLWLSPLLLALALLVAITPTTADDSLDPAARYQPTQEDQSKLEGRWKVAYHDSLLGQVAGEAISNGEEIRVSLTHPQTGEVYQLQSTEIQWQSPEQVLIVLEGTSPAAPAEAAPKLDDLPRLELGPDAQRMQLRTGTLETEHPVIRAGLADEKKLFLNFTLSDDNQLTGTWRYRADLLTHRRPDGSGRVGTFERRSDREMMFGLQQGMTVWLKHRPRILATICANDQLAVGLDGSPSYTYPWAPGNDPRMGTQRTLILIGENLPAAPGELARMTADDPHLEYHFRAAGDQAMRHPLWSQDIERTWARLTEGLSASQQAALRSNEVAVVEVRLREGVLPGRKRFTLNGAPGEWTLAFGDATGHLQFVREVRDDEWETTGLLFVPEIFRVQLTVRAQLPIEEIPLLLGRGGEVARVGGADTLIARRVPGEPNVYRTAPIDLYRTGGAPPDGVLWMAAGAGDQLFARIGEDGLIQLLPAPGQERPDAAGPFMARARVHGTPAELGELWREALKRAADCAGLEVDDWSTIGGREADSISNVVLFDGSMYRVPIINITVGEPVFAPKLERIRVTVRDHAAMLLLRDTFVDLMEAQLAEYDRIQGPVMMRGFARLIEPVVDDDRHPMGRLMVTAPNGHPVGLGAAFRPDWIAEYFKLGPQQTRQWCDGAIQEGLDNLRESMRGAIERARAAETCDIEELLALTGYGFEAVVEHLTARLMKLEEFGHPPTQRWTPDLEARAAVRTLHILGGAVQAQEDYARADTHVALAVASLVAMPLAAGESALAAGAALAVDAADVALVLMQEVPDYMRRRADVRFREGGSFVLGTAGLDQAKEREISTLELAVSIIGAGVGAGASGLEAIPKLRQALRSTDINQIRTSGAASVERFADGGLDTFRAMDLDEQARLLAYMADARVVKQSAGAQALTDAQRSAITLADRLEGEAAARSAASAAGTGAARRGDEALAGSLDGMRLDDLHRADAAGDASGAAQPSRTTSADAERVPSAGEGGGITRAVENAGSGGSPTVRLPETEMPPTRPIADEAFAAPSVMHPDRINPRDPGLSAPPRRADADASADLSSTPRRPEPTSPTPRQPDTSASSSRLPDTASSPRLPDTGGSRLPDTSASASRLPDTGASRLPDTGASSPRLPQPSASASRLPEGSAPTVRLPREADPSLTTRFPDPDLPPAAAPSARAPRAGDADVAEAPVAWLPRAAGDAAATPAPPVRPSAPDVESPRVPASIATPDRFPPPGMPQPHTRWDPGDGSPPIELGEYLGQGRFASVYRMPGDPPRVMKIYRQADDTTATPAEVVRDMRKGHDLLEAEQIEQLAIRRFAPDAPRPYVVQDALDPATMRTFDRHTTPAEFGPEFQDAVARLYAEFGRKGLIWEDGHIENLYFRHDGERWHAGVLDQDRIARFDDWSGRLGDIRDTIERYPHFNNIVAPNQIESLRHATFPGADAARRGVFPDASFFMEKMLEYQGRWVRFKGDAFEPVMIDPNIARQHFPGMGEHTHFDFARNAPNHDHPPFRVQGAADAPPARTSTPTQPTRIEVPDQPLRGTDLTRGELPANPRLPREMDAPASPVATSRPELTPREVTVDELTRASDALDDRIARAQQRVARLQERGGSSAGLKAAQDQLDNLEQRRSVLDELAKQADGGGPVRLPEQHLDWLTGRSPGLTFAQQQAAKARIMEDFAGEWGRVTSALNRTPAGRAELQQLLSSRKQTVDRLLDEVIGDVERLTGGPLERQAFGSSNLTSDYDLSISGPGAELVVIEFNRRFRNLHGGRESGSVFDTNVYTQPVYDLIDPRSTLGRGLSPRQHDDVRQFMYQHMAAAKYMDDAQWARHADAVLEATPQATRATVRRLLDEVHSRERAARQVIADELLKAGSTDANTVLRVQNELYARSLARIHDLRKLNGALDDLAAGRSAVLDLPPDLRRSAMARDLARHQELVGLGRHDEAAALLADLRAATAQQLRNHQGSALYFASEAYQSEGTIRHVVGELQAAGRAKSLTAEVLRAAPPADVPLPRGHYAASYNENLANLFKELNHAAALEGGRLRSGLDPAKAQKAATKTAKYFIRQLDAAHRAGVNLTDVLPTRLHGLIDDTVALERARSDPNAFIEALAAHNITAEDFVNSAMEASELLTRAVHTRSPVHDVTDQLRRHYDELDADLAEFSSPTVAPPAREMLSETSDLPAVRVDDPQYAARNPPRAAPAPAPAELPLPEPNTTWRTPAGETLQLGDRLGEGKFAEVYALTDRPSEAVKFIRRGGSGMPDARSAAQIAEEAQTISNLLRERGIRQLEVLAVGADEAMPFVRVRRLPDEAQVLDPARFRTMGRDQMIAEGQWSTAHERAVIELFHDLARNNLVWEDAHLGNIYFEQVDGRLVAGVLDHDRIADLAQLPEHLDGWKVLMELQPRRHGIGSNVGRGPRANEMTTAAQFMAKMFEHKGWIRFNEHTGKFETGWLDPDLIDRELFPLEQWVNPDLLRDGPMSLRFEGGGRAARAA